jgi:hypothetical protein
MTVPDEATAAIVALEASLAAAKAKPTDPHVLAYEAELEKRGREAWEQREAIDAFMGSPAYWSEVWDARPDDGSFSLPEREAEIGQRGRRVIAW